MRGTPSSALIILYYPNRGLGVPSIFYRGPRGPFFAVGGFPPCFTGVPGDPCSGVYGFPPIFTGVPGHPLLQLRIFPHVLQRSLGTPSAMEIFPHVLQGSPRTPFGNGGFPPCFTRVPWDPCQGIAGSFHFRHGSLVLACVQVYFVISDSMSLLVGRKLVGFP